jgi:hypothetical protein
MLHNISRISSRIQKDRRCRTHGLIDVKEATLCRETMHHTVIPATEDRGWLLLVAD